MTNYYQLVKEAKNKTHKEKKAIIDQYIKEVEDLYHQMDALFDLLGEERIILESIDGVTDEELSFFDKRNLRDIDKEELKKRVDHMSKKVTEHNKNNDDDDWVFDIFSLDEKFSLEDFIAYHAEGAFYERCVKYNWDDLAEDQSRFRCFLRESNYFRK